MRIAVTKAERKCSSCGVAIKKGEKVLEEYVVETLQLKKDNYHPRFINKKRSYHLVCGRVLVCKKMKDLEREKSRLETLSNDLVPIDLRMQHGIDTLKKELSELKNYNDSIRNRREIKEVQACIYILEREWSEQEKVLRRSW